MRAPYGAPELVRKYRQNLERGFEASILLHLMAVGIYWGTISRNPSEDSSRSALIERYEEVRVVPGISNVQFGMLENPILIKPQAVNSGPSFTKKKNAQPRAAGQPRTLADLPSALPSDKIDAASLNPQTNERYYRSGPAGGGAGEPNTVRGGNVIPARDGDSPTGTALSGVGSDKPVPGIYGSGGLGGSDLVGDGSGGGNGLGYSMTWMGGGMRRKIAGELPNYPDGVKDGAQIKIFAVVMPDGSVKSVQPAQKANTKLEDVAMKEIRLWRFEPLRSNQPQIEQSCVVTFLFTLK